MVVEREVRSRHRDQGDVAVDPAVEREVRSLRVGRGVRCVVDHDSDDVVVRLGWSFECGRQLAPERRVAAVVMDEMCPVQVHVGRRVGAAELQPHLVVAGIGREPLDVGGGTPPVVVAAVLPVEGVPGVRQRHRFTRRRGEIRIGDDCVGYEDPPFVEPFHTPSGGADVVGHHVPSRLDVVSPRARRRGSFACPAISASRVCPPAATNRSIRSRCAPVERSRDDRVALHDECPRRPERRRLVSRQRRRPPASPRFVGRRHGRCARGHRMGPSGRASRWRAVRRRPRRDRSTGCRALVLDRRSVPSAPCRRRRRECRGRPRAGRRRLRSEPKRRSRPHSSSHPPPWAIPSSRPIVTRRPVRRRVNVAAAMFGSVAGTYGGARSRSMCTSPCIRKKSGSALRNTTTRTDSSASSRSNVSRRATKNGPSTRFVGGWSIVTVATASSISTCNAIDRCFPSARTSPVGNASLNDCTRLFGRPISGQFDAGEPCEFGEHRVLEHRIGDGIGRTLDLLVIPVLAAGRGHAGRHSRPANTGSRGRGPSRRWRRGRPFESEPIRGRRRCCRRRASVVRSPRRTRRATACCLRTPALGATAAWSTRCHRATAIRGCASCC